MEPTAAATTDETSNNNAGQFSVINLNSSVNENEKKTEEHLNAGFVNDETVGDFQGGDFQRNRPGTTTSIRSTASNSSRSSVNCATGQVRCPNLRLTKFFSYKEGGLDKVIHDLRGVIIEQIDGKVLGSWLLIEIDHWDLHRERVVVLTDKSLLVVSYDFITKKVKDFKRTMLTEITGVQYGNLTYPNKSMMGQYLYGACKIRWGEDPGLLTRWNPFSNNIPFYTFTSHHILYNEKEQETSIYNCDDFIQTLELAVSRLPVVQKVEFKEGPIEIESYASLLSVMYNQNWIGFQLDRNGVNF